MMIRAYQKGELAAMYYPWCSQRQALRCFRRDLELATELNQRLQLTGWRPSRRVLTPVQVRLIFEALGEPLD
ncbi:MAG: DUF4248 domain-containing protein [Bacteroidaceae bacterium]|nr:DUF4248 domain-containing protein [Bacteroidaceae bacterium]